ncbi:MAG: hypothetical protein EXX96DRAFT_543008 [Benjaminiella poitrasii]|nr:MAG: hypothetical protein EXX96DRAFT_543008 [Benjaminiella poitrasii]
MKASKVLKTSKQIILTDTVLPDGLSELDFEISVPNRTFSSFESKFCQIKHSIFARISHSSLFKCLKPKRITTVEKTIQVLKTPLPKEVVLGSIPPYLLTPSVLMTGSRDNLMQWSFRTPEWACLEDEIVFRGMFNSLSADKHISLINAQVDVIQEELYFYDVSCVKYKRRIVSLNNSSYYSNIQFNSDTRFSVSLKSCYNKVDQYRATLKGVSYTSKLDPSLNSPFLEIRHFIRVIIYLTNRTTICVGLPIQLIALPTNETEGINEALPTYQSVLNDGKLPEYDSHHFSKNNYSYQYHRHANLTDDFNNNTQQLQNITLLTLTKDSNDEHFNFIQPINQHQHNCNSLCKENIITVKERTVGDFCLVK